MNNSEHAFSGPPIHRNRNQNRRAVYAQAVFVSGDRGSDNFYTAICYYQFHFSNNRRSADCWFIRRAGILPNKRHTIAAIPIDGTLIFYRTEKVSV